MENTFSSEGSFIPTRTAQHIQSLMSELSPSEARVAQYILLNLHRIAYETGASIAEKALVSPITVSRFLRRAGYEGIGTLKKEVQQEAIAVTDEGSHSVISDKHIKATFDKDLNILVNLFRQFEGETWKGIVNCVAAAERVYVSGFQTIRGVAEDFSRRLSLARPNVQCLSAHDSMLGEWLSNNQKRSPQEYQTLILIDVVPYAQETRLLCEIASEKGIQLVIITDEFCYWAKEYTPHILHAKSKTGLFLEATWGLVLAGNMLVDQVAHKNPESKQRAKDWFDLAKRLSLF